MTRSLDDIADRLYALPPTSFISARDDEVAQARAEGDRDAAKAIAALRRPTVSAWLVNLLALRRADGLAELAELGVAMREAQSGLKGDELRELAAKRRKAVAELVAAAAGLAADAGAPRSSLPVGEVETTLNAAVADAEIARDVRSGRLVKAIQYDGFGEMPRPDLQVVPGGRSTPSAGGTAETPKSRSSGRTGGRGASTSRAATKSDRAEPGATRNGKAAKATTKASEPDEAVATISSAALARRRVAKRKLHQAEVGLAAARNAYHAAERALRDAEETERQARDALDAAEQAVGGESAG